jgi:hypothetical protein
VSLYAIEQRVWVKSANVLGIVKDAGYTRRSDMGVRRAKYMVRLQDGVEWRITDLVTDSSNLRAADWCCDGCGRWLPGQPHRTAPDGEYPNGLSFCFLCVNVKETT